MGMNDTTNWSRFSAKCKQESKKLYGLDDLDEKVQPRTLVADKLVATEAKIRFTG